MRYKIVTNNETEGLGINGVIILNLLKEHRRNFYKQLISENRLKEQIQKWENNYNTQMRALIMSGLNEVEAREIAWPEITARFGM